MRCSKLRYYSDLELASTSKKIDKDEFFQGALNCRFTDIKTVVTQTLELSFYSQWNCRNPDTKTVIPYTIDSPIFMN